MFRERFNELGYYGPVPLLSRSEAHRLLRSLQHPKEPAAVWSKGLAASERAYFEIGTHPLIVERVQEILGENVSLWGASIQTRHPGFVHPWHSDIESSDPTSKTVAVWIGLKNTRPETSLSLITHSHLTGMTIQEVRQRVGVDRSATTEDDVVRWAKEFDPRCESILAAMGDGEALFFDGRMWHGSNNLGKGTRHALLLQYSSPEVPIRIPDFNQLDWPFRRLEVPRPPCVLVRGYDDSAANDVVSGPVIADGSSSPHLTSRIQPLSIPLPEEADTRWKPFPLFHGRTADLNLGCHASYLHQGHSPHPPHSHVEEELLVMLRGEAELQLPEVGGGTRRLTAGELVYYPAWFPHTLRAISSESANYLMFKWTSGQSNAGDRVSFGQFRVSDYAAMGAEGFQPRVIFDGSSDHLRRLQAHASTLSPGAGYEPHVDAYDVALVVLEGSVETLGQVVGPYDVVFYRAGEPHGIRNPTSNPATYVVVEFHGGRTSVEPVRRSRGSRLKNVVKQILPEPVLTMLRRSWFFRRRSHDS